MSPRSRTDAGRRFAATLACAVALGAADLASACSCYELSTGTFTVTVDSPTYLPTNGVFRLWRRTGEPEVWVVVDADGVEVPVLPREFPTVDGGVWIELAPLEPLTLGETYWLREAGRTIGGSEHVVDREEDLDPPVLSDADFRRTSVRDTSCGLWRVAQLELDYEADDGEGIGVRIRDLASGLYWHGGMAWTTLCGGHPERHWAGRKEVTLYDAAGNESEPVRTGVTRGCHCDGAPRPPGSGWGLAALGALVGLRARRVTWR